MCRASNDPRGGYRCDTHIAQRAARAFNHFDAVYNRTDMTPSARRRSLDAAAERIRRADAEIRARAGEYAVRFTSTGDAAYAERAKRVRDALPDEWYEAVELGGRRDPRSSDEFAAQVAEYDLRALDGCHPSAQEEEKFHYDCCAFFGNHNNGLESSVPEDFAASGNIFRRNVDHAALAHEIARIPVGIDYGDPTYTDEPALTFTPTRGISRDELEKRAREWLDMTEGEARAHGLPSIWLTPRKNPRKNTVQEIAVAMFPRGAITLADRKDWNIG